jgi:hypothetical protein
VVASIIPFGGTKPAKLNDETYTVTRTDEHALTMERPLVNEEGDAGLGAAPRSLCSNFGLRLKV